MAIRFPFLKFALAASCALTLTLPVGASETHSFIGDGKRYVALDGTLSRRIDLADADDRSLLTSLILRREGRVYAFEKRPAVLEGSGRPLMQPDVFDLGLSGHSNRLTAAISDGRSVFYVTWTGDHLSGSGGALDKSARRASEPRDLVSDKGASDEIAAEGSSGKGKIVDEGYSYVTADGVVSRRIDLASQSDRRLLTSMIMKRKGRVLGFEEDPKLVVKPSRSTNLVVPSLYDFSRKQDADRFHAAIETGTNTFFLETGVNRKTTQTATTSIRPAVKKEAVLPTTTSGNLETTRSEIANAEAKELAELGRGGPIELMPGQREKSSDFSVYASNTSVESDAEPVLQFLDQPAKRGESILDAEAMSDEQPINISDEVSGNVPSDENVEMAALFEADELISSSNETPPDEALVIAEIERGKQIDVEAKKGKKTSSAKSGEVKILDAPKQRLDLAVGEGRLLQLGEPIAKLLIADPNVADARAMSENLIYVFGNQAGQTNVFALTDGEKMAADFDIRVGSNVSAARDRLRDLQPNTMADFSSLGDQVVAQGLVRDANEAVQVAALGDSYTESGKTSLNNTVIPGAQQVNIRVRFAEVSRSDVTRLGINWQAILDSGDFLFGLSSGNLFLPGNVGGINPTESFGSVFGNGSFGDVDLDLLLEGLEREGIVNVLAEPNLTTINGRPANFLAGGEVPIPVPQSDDIITIDYKPFGVSLDFLPTLMPGNRINLQIRPEVSSITNSGGVLLEGFNIPAFTVRRAETSVELASGQTFAIAGLFQRRVSNDIDKFPVIADVPVIGNLFKSPRFQRSETELVILITPYLVQPTKAQHLTTPNQRMDRSVPPLEPRQAATGLGGFIIE